MTKKQFYNDPDVQDMAKWMAARFDSTAGWKHKNFNSIYDAFKQYKWRGKDWKTNKKYLDLYRSDLRKALQNNNAIRIKTSCVDILTWGNTKTGNIDYLNCRKNSIISELKNMESLLSNNKTPANLCVPSNHICRYEHPEYRMNAGFSKIYSLLCDFCVMYDSRVAAALCLLVKQFCINIKTIPSNLVFAWPEKNRSTKNRNPNKVNPVLPVPFPKIKRKQNLFYTDQIMHASWLLCLALHENPNVFSKGEEGFHELAAGLFMIGEDLN